MCFVLARDEQTRCVWTVSHWTHLCFSTRASLAWPGSAPLLGWALRRFHAPVPLAHTVLSSIHSVLLNVTLRLASGDGSVLSWLVDLCHLVLALRG